MKAGPQAAVIRISEGQQREWPGWPVGLCMSMCVCVSVCLCVSVYVYVCLRMCVRVPMCV